MPTAIDLDIRHPDWMEVSPGKLHGLAYSVFSAGITDCSSGLEPFTVWPLRAGMRSGLSTLRMTWLRDDDTHLEGLITTRPIRFGSARCSVDATRTVRKAYAQLAMSRACSAITFEFHTPTLFARDGRSWPIPDPQLVLGSLARRWNAHSPIAIDGDDVREIGKHLDVTRLAGRTSAAVAGRAGDTIGFVGELDVALRPTASSTHKQTLSTLAHSAEFLGVGKQTTYGFGVVTGRPTGR